MSFVGVALPIPTPQLQSWIDALIPQESFTGWSAWNFDGYDLQNLPTPPLPEEPPIRLGVLNWPTGASRPAFFYGVVNQSKLDEIRTALGDPSTFATSPQPLVMFDGRTGKTVTASMYFLPPRPLAQYSNTGDAWLVTLTDLRFYWPWKRGTIFTQPSSWDSLYATLAGFLGVTIDAEAVPAAYGVPSAKWIGAYRPTPAVLDAVAATVGQRVVVALDGTVKTVTWQTAQANSATLLDGVTKQAGGTLVQEDINRYVPASVVTLFNDISTGSPSATPFPITSTLASLLIPDYTTATGVDGVVMTVFADTPYTGVMTTAVNYATQAATDWYGWRCANVDISIPGIEPWVPTGWEDTTEWTFQLRDGDEPYADTRIRRGPYNDFTSGSWDTLGGNPPSPTQPMVTDVCPVVGSTVVVTDDWEMTRNEFKIAVDASGGAVTVTLPQWRDGDFYIVVKIDTSGNAVTVNTFGGTGEINGSSSTTLAAQWDCKTFDTLDADDESWFVS